MLLHTASTRSPPLVHTSFSFHAAALPRLIATYSSHQLDDSQKRIIQQKASWKPKMGYKVERNRTGPNSQSIGKENEKKERKKERKKENKHIEIELRSPSASRPHGPALANLSLRRKECRCTARRIPSTARAYLLEDDPSAKPLRPRHEDFAL